MDIKRSHAYYISEAKKTLQNRMREQQGSARRLQTTSPIWMHVTEIGQSFDFENAYTMNHDRLKGKRLMEEGLHSAP